MRTDCKKILCSGSKILLNKKFFGILNRENLKGITIYAYFQFNHKTYEIQIKSIMWEAPHFPFIGIDQNIKTTQNASLKTLFLSNSIQ